LVAAVLALIPAGALAQTTTAPITNPLEVKVDGDSLNGQMVLYVTAQQCDAATEAEYEFSATYQAQVPVFEVWVGQSGNDCTTVESRQKNNASAKPACRRVAVAAESSSKLSMKLKARDLFTVTWDQTDKVCDQASNQPYTVYFLPLAQETNLDGNTATAVLASVPTLKAVFTLYTKRPTAPTGLSGDDGESELTAKFTIIAGAAPKTKYRVYFDWGESADQECGSGALVAGESAPAVGGRVERVEVNTGKAVLSGLDTKGIDLNQSVAAAVVTVDPAGSESFLSAPVCITRVQTDGAWDVCQRDPHCKDQFDSCSLRQAVDRRGGSGGGLLLLAGLGIALAIRRRHV
jgi:hypothetical protein